jgi:hypothetical protein
MVGVCGVGGWEAAIMAILYMERSECCRERGRLIGGGGGLVCSTI